ncbi:MAG: hypothetical protein IJV72_01685 [Clostridia bacterium]|nr:hypothetical protein [Clostridia bacterium]
MQIDRQSLEKLLSLNDRQLKNVINKLAADSGIDPATFNINVSDIQSIRQALSGATDSDLARVAEMYEQNKKKGK